MGRIRVLNELGDSELATVDVESLPEMQRQLRKYLVAGHLAYDIKEKQQITKADQLTPKSDVIVTPLVLIG